MKTEKPARTPGSKTAKNRELLTTKQKKFIQGKLKGLSSRKAALQAGYSERTAAHANKDIAKKPAVNAALKTWLTHVGITTELIATRLREGMDAKDGNSTNWAERRQHLLVAAKALGLYVDKVQVDPGPTLGEILARSWKE